MDTITTELTVTGMTCAHCVAAVTEKIGKLPGVHDVDVDLGSGRVVVHSVTQVDPGDLAAAVDEAGYEVSR